MVKVLPISDIHGQFGVFRYITNAGIEPDLITISGDLHKGYALEPQELIDEVEMLQHKMNCPIVIIQGNHDYWNPMIFRDSRDIHVLHNSGIEICGLKIWGSPFTPTFLDWNHMLEDGVYGLDNIFKGMMPNGLDILLSHGPPYGYGDTCRYGAWENTPDDHLGSTSVLEGIQLHKPRYVFCGHIHTGIRYNEIDHTGGAVIKELPEPPEKTYVYNVSVLDERYAFRCDNPAPEIVEIEII